MAVLQRPVLNALQRLQEAARHRPDGAVAEHLLGVAVAQRTEVGHARGRAGAERLHGIVEHLLDRHRALLHRDPLLGRQLDDGAPRDAGQDGVAERRGHQAAVAKHEEQVAGGALLHVAMVLGVQEHALQVAGHLRLALGQRAGHVVGAALDPAGAAGGGAYPLGGDGGRGDAVGEVGADPGGDHHEPGRLAQVHPDAALGQREGPYIYGVPTGEVVALPGRVVGGREADRLVARHHAARRCHELVHRHARHVQPLHGALHADGVFARAEQLERSVRLRKRLQALEAGHRVLGRVVDQRQSGKLVALAVQPLALRVRQRRLLGGAEVALLDVLGLPCVSVELAQVDPRIDGKTEFGSHANCDVTTAAAPGQPVSRGHFPTRS